MQVVVAMIDACVETEDHEKKKKKDFFERDPIFRLDGQRASDDLPAIRCRIALRSWRAEHWNLNHQMVAAKLQG